MRRTLAIGASAVLALAIAGLWWSTRPEAVVEAPSAPPSARPDVRTPEAPPNAPEVAPRPPPAAPVVEAPRVEASDDDPDRRQIQDALAATFAARFPDRRPTEAELARMTAALLRMRAARDAMRALEGTPDEGGERRRLRDELGEAVADFERTAEHPLSEVTRETGAGGITTTNDPDEEVVFETMDDEVRR